MIDGFLADSRSTVYKKIAEAIENFEKNQKKVDKQAIYLASGRYFKLKPRPKCKDEFIEHENSESEEEFTVFDEKFRISPNDMSFTINIKNIGLFSYVITVMMTNN